MDFKPQLWQQPFVASLSPWLKPSLIMKQTTFSGFDKQMDVVNLYTSAGHSPACFWIGGYESDAENMVFTWNISARVMDKYFIEWESGYPKNRWIETKLTVPGIPLDLIPPPSSRSGGNEETSKNLSNCCVTLLPWNRIKFSSELYVPTFLLLLVVFASLAPIQPGVLITLKARYWPNFQ